MLARLRKATDENKQGGFTLIELLVVMIIIGILAAIAIPAFLNQKKKAKETSAKADVTTIGKEIAAYYVDGTSKLVVSGGSATTAGNWTIAEDGAAANAAPVATGKLSQGNTASATNANITGDGAWCVQVATADSVTWKYSATGGLGKGACSGTS